MKKIIFVLFVVFTICAGVFAQSDAIIYVSVKGSNENDGLSEAKPMKSLNEALVKARSQSIKTITIIGTLDINSLSAMNQNAAFFINNNAPQDITITGKPDAKGAERAVLSGKGSGGAVILINSGIKVNFEHIEISGGTGSRGWGIFVNEGASVTLGAGAIVRDNEGMGLFVSGNCIIDGGEIRNNRDGGVWMDGVVTMLSGTIRNNGSSSSSAGGVAVFGGGHFTMSGGTITSNRAQSLGGGIFVLSGGRFDQTGGTIRGNNITKGGSPNVFRDEGSLGSNL